MAKKEEYIALSIKGITWSSGADPPVATVTAERIFALTGISGEHSKTYSPITGQTKEEVSRKLEKQKTENNLFLPDLGKLPKNAEIIIIPLK